MNATNRTLNGTRHAEFQAIAQILSPPPAEADYPPISTTPSSTVAARAPLRSYPPSIFKETDLYVTVEPCIMCASLLRQYGIRKVYFGASNDRFGGTGGVFSIHQGPGPEKGYPVSGGWLREEAIMLLRRFYVQQNEKGMCLFRFHIVLVLVDA
jgi:tRNA-specific adenosine deaminase 2